MLSYAHLEGFSFPNLLLQCEFQFSQSLQFFAGMHHTLYICHQIPFNILALHPQGMSTFMGKGHIMFIGAYPIVYVSVHRMHTRERIY